MVQHCATFQCIVRSNRETERGSRMTSLQRTTVHAGTCAGGIARVLAVSTIVACAAHLAGPLYGENFGACGSNICASSATANVAIGTPLGGQPAYQLDVL